MPSPFPGVDPFIEDQHYWPDFHARFINHLSDKIADMLPDDYEVRIDEFICLETPGEKIVLPDVQISKRGRGSPAVPSRNAPAAAMTLEVDPVTIPVAMFDPERHSFLRILHRPDRSVVTVIELLSPTNKHGDGYTQYMAKRTELIYEPVHIVELDFLIDGRRIRLKRRLPPGDYYAFVMREGRRPDCDVYAWPLERPIPNLPIPLRAPDPDIKLNVGAVFATTYERGRYARSIDYNKPLSLPLDPAKKKWAAERVKSTRR